MAAPGPSGPARHPAKAKKPTAQLPDHESVIRGPEIQWQFNA
jgi:hypothetical protein